MINENFIVDGGWIEIIEDGANSGDENDDENCSPKVDSSLGCRWEFASVSGAAHALEEMHRVVKRLDMRTSVSNTIRETLSKGSTSFDHHERLLFALIDGKETDMEFFVDLVAG